ncbi:hypothetical protein MPLDJ20_190071 [Mesorhizobium plurifarium]|uniref:Uncharacterized protein n=1 Tax=Mesorhizobium plurifarium TaxID=69974 RepID=A0A090ET65_MESPL|nr:hypothetical protein MPLDJ20_190071 [Mesorhizobium plurifarium]
MSIDSRTHGVVHSSINNERKLGNVGGDFVELFNDLSESRGVARYARPGDVKIRAGDNALSIAEGEMATLQLRFRRELDG